MKILALAVLLLTSPAFASKVSLSIYNCAEMNRYSAETGADYSTVSKSVLVHDACAREVQEEGTVTDIEFNEQDPSILELSVTVTNHYHLIRDSYGFLDISFASVEAARAAKATLESGKIGMLVVNPRDFMAINVDSNGIVDSTKIGLYPVKSEVNLHGIFSIEPQQLLMVYKPAVKKRAPSSGFRAFIQALKSKL